MSGVNRGDRAALVSLCRPHRSTTKHTPSTELRSEVHLINNNYLNYVSEKGGLNKSSARVGSTRLASAAPKTEGKKRQQEKIKNVSKTPDRQSQK
jgi:hypothetical protein